MSGMARRPCLRRSTCSTARCWAAACSVTGIRSSSASSTRSRRACPPARSSTPSSTTMRPTSTRGARLALASSALGVPLHPDLGLLDQRRRGFFSALTGRRLKRGDFRSLVDLQAAINRYIAEHNEDPRPSSGPSPTPSSPRSSAGIKRWRLSTSDRCAGRGRESNGAISWLHGRSRRSPDWTGPEAAWYRDSTALAARDWKD